MMRRIAPPTALRAGTRILEVASTRLFSTSPSQRKDVRVIKFEPASTPELDATLKKIYETIVLPTYLPEESRRRLRRKTFEQKLARDPLTIEVEGTKYKFRHTNVTKLPTNSETFLAAFHTMNTAQDFANLGPLLEAMHRSGRTVRTEWLAMLIRKAGEFGALDTVLQCASQVRRTNLRLIGHEPVNRLLLVIQQAPIESGWDDRLTRKALRQIEMVIDMLEEKPEHQPMNEMERKKLGCRFPMHKDPIVLGARLHMAAAVAVHLEGAKDTDAKVTKYAQELISLWPESTGLRGLQEPSAYVSKNKLYYLVRRPECVVEYAAPLLNGLQLAAQVVDPATQFQLQNRADAIDIELREALKQLDDEGRPERGKYMYDKLFGGEA